MEGDEKEANGGNKGGGVSCLIQGHGSVHVLGRHHLLQERVSTPAKRTVQASAKYAVTPPTP